MVVVVVVMMIMKTKIDFNNMGLSPYLCKAQINLPHASWITLVPRTTGEGAIGSYPTLYLPTLQVNISAET